MSAALPHLTDQDLKDIGVLLGHRRIMLAAISKLAGAAAATPEPTARTEPKAQDTAERRQVTVMFSDLVGSTALSGAHGPGRPARGHFGLSEVRRGDRAVASAGSSRSTWATGSSSISATRRRTRTTQSGPCAQGWSWSLR